MASSKMSKSKADEKLAPPEDLSRMQEADPRDPRSRNVWPCFKNHNGSVKGSNWFGSWVHCSVCALRLSYVPRMSAPATHQQTMDPTVVQKAMDMLQTDLKGKQPHYELFRKTIEKAEVDNRQYNYILHGTYSKTSTTSWPPSTPSAPAPKAFIPPHQAEDVPIRHHVGTPPAPSDVEIQETDPEVVQHALDIDAGDVSRGKASLGPEDEQYDKSQCRADRRQLDENLVTNKVAKAGARMVQLMVLQLSLNFQNLIIEPGQVSIWEVCCSPTSSLTSARAKEQLNCQRINLANGFDLDKASKQSALCIGSSVQDGFGLACSAQSGAHGMR